MRVIFVEQSYSPPRTENIYITSLGVNDSLSGFFFFNGGIHRNMVYKELFEKHDFQSLCITYIYFNFNLLNKPESISVIWLAISQSITIRISLGLCFLH